MDPDLLDQPVWGILQGIIGPVGHMTEIGSVKRQKHTKIPWPAHWI